MLRLLRQGSGVWLTAFALLGLLARGGAAQPGRISGGEAVFLDTDGNAVKKLGQARDFLAAGQWSDAVDLLRQIVDQHNEKLVPASPGRYVNVQTYCDMLLASLPPEGLKIYRARVDPQAKQWYAAACETHDEALLAKILQYAFVSSYGDDALLLLGEWAFERGDLSRARGFWRMLLPPAQPPPGQIPTALVYPDAQVEPAQIEARLVLCSYLQRNFARGDRELQAFAKQFPEASGDLAGQTGNLLKILRDTTAAMRASEFPHEDPDVSTFACNPARNKVLPVAVDVGTVQWTAPLKEVRAESSDHPALMAVPPVLSYHPVVFNNIVLVGSETAIYAYDLQTGKPAWPAGDPADAAIYSLPPEKHAGPLTAGLPQFTLTVDQGRLYARLGAATAGHVPGNGLEGRHSSLVCLDLARGEGKAVWSIDDDEITVDGGHWTFEGSPIAGNGRVYVSIYRGKPRPQANVICLDADTGRLLWNRRVCIGMEILGGDVHEIRQELLTLAEDRLYYTTNLGAIAALDAQQGGLRWVAVYPHVDAEKIWAFNKRQAHGPNPCLYYEGVVFAAPTDSGRVFAFDADTGAVKWSRELKGGARALLGVGQGRLILSGDQLWALDAETGNMVWPTLDSGSFSTDPEARGWGRGILAADVVYWPTREEILVFDQADGTLRRRINLVQPHHQSGGNLIVANGMLLVAATTRLAAFCDHGRLQQRYRDEIILRPNAPQPHYQWAILEESAGRFDLAIDHYEQALKLAGPDATIDGLPLPELVAKRLYHVLKRAAERALTAHDAQRAAACYARQVAVARSDIQRLDALLGLATAHEKSDPEKAVAAWQQILDSPSLRRVRWSEPGRPPAPAARLARARINALIAVHQRQIYAPFELAAVQQFEEAFARGDLLAAAEALQRYPNAAVAEPAALRLAAVERRSQNPAAAQQIYKHLLAEPGAGAVRKTALLELARSAEEQRHWRSAGRWWQLLAEEFPQETVTDGDERRPAAEFVARRLAQEPFRSEHSGGVAPVFPWAPVWENRFVHSDGVVFPDGAAPSAELSLALVRNDGAVGLNLRTGRAAWRAPLNERLLWAGCLDDALMLGGRSSLCAVTYASGRIVWERSFAPTPDRAAAAADAPSGLPRGGMERSLGAVSPDFDKMRRGPETPAPQGQTFSGLATIEGRCANAAPPAFRICGQDVIILDPARGVHRFDGSDGARLWTYTPRAGTLQARWHCCNERIVVQLLAPHRIVVLDAATGAVLFESLGPEQPWLANPTLLDDGRLGLVAGGTRIELFDPMTGKTAWTYSGPISQANAEPRLLTNGSALLLVTDGDTLVNLDAATGARGWSRRLGTDFVVAAERAAALDRHHVYIASAGILRCFALVSGGLVWERYLGRRDGDWRAVTAGPFVVAYPVRSADRAPIVICSAATGDFVERLHLIEPTDTVDLRLFADGSLLSAGDRITALGQPAAR